MDFHSAVTVQTATLASPQKPKRLLPNSIAGPDRRTDNPTFD
jgi:hypothetical protein